MTKKPNQSNKEKIKHLGLDETFNGGNNYKYVLEHGLRLDMVRTVMKINEIINYLNGEK